MRVFYYSCEFVWVAVETWMTFALLGTLGEARRQRRTELFLRGIMAALMAGLDVFNRLTTCTLFSNGLLVFSCMVICPLGCFLYRISPGKSFIISYLFWVAVAYQELFLQVLLYIVTVELWGKPPVFLHETVWRGVYLLLNSLVIIKLGQWLCREFASIYERVKFRFLVGVVSFVGTFLLMTYLQRIYLLEVSVEYMGIWEIVVLAVIFALVMIGSYILRERREQEKKLVQIKLDTLRDNYKQVKGLYQEKSTLLHDEKNHILAVRSLVENGNVDQAMEYMDQLSRQLHRQEVLTYLTGHEFLDMFLNLKKGQAEQEGIGVWLSFERIGGLKLSDMEICSLFANLLDNAIEANQKLKKGENRWIRLAGSCHGQTLVITLKNPVKGGGRLKQHEIQTTKDRLHHGFGMQSIQKVVDRYDGCLKYSIDEGEFSLMLSMECVEAENNKY